MKTVTPPNADEAHLLPATVSVVTAGQFFGLGRDAAYDSARRGLFPCQVLRIGGRYRVTRAALLAALGLTNPGNPLASAASLEVSEPSGDA